MLLASGKGTYQPLDMNSLSDTKAAEISRKILQATKADGWQMGKTRVFLRAGQLALLEVSTEDWIWDFLRLSERRGGEEAAARMS